MIVVVNEDRRIVYKSEKSKEIKKNDFYFLDLSSLSDTSCQFITFHQADT